MSSRMAVLCIIVALLAVVSSAAQSSPAPAADCSNLVMKMADCLDFVSEGSKTTKPEGNCCSGLKTVLKTDAECLCQTFRNAGQFGVKLNNTKALTLPAACHVSAPSISNCGLSIGTGAAPAMSPVAGAPANSIGSGPAPAPAPGKSSGASVVAPIGLLVVAASFTLL